MLTTHYLAIKLLHIALVLASGALFVARGGGVLAGQAWPMVPLVRRLSVLIDVALLTAGVTLWLLLSWHPLQHPWLGACRAWGASAANRPQRSISHRLFAP